MATKKTKTKTKKVKTKKEVVKVKSYESHYLAIILIVFVLLEGFFMTSTRWSDWQKGLELLDVSMAVEQTTSDFIAVMQPVIDAYDGVNQFYQIAATEMTKILDLSDPGPLYELALISEGVNDFYQQAATEMISLLDMSDNNSWPARVAGISISR